MFMNEHGHPMTLDNFWFLNVLKYVLAAGMLQPVFWSHNQRIVYHLFAENVCLMLL